MSDSPVACVAKSTKKPKYDEWEIKDWVRTLKEAEEIKEDPEKMKLLKPHLKKEIKSIEDLKDLVNNYDKDEE